MKNQAKIFNIGPKAIAEPAIENGPKFVLSTDEWFAIQRYVINGLSKEIMPHTEADFRAFLGENAPDDISNFIPLMDAYKAIFEHVTVWNDDTFPASVSLASDIVSYANQAEIYYKPILPLAEALTKNPDDEVSRQKLDAILEVLINQANDHHIRAEEVFQKIKLFADQSTQDRITLAGPDGESGLKKRYNDEYGETSDFQKDTANEIELELIKLEAATKEYEKYVKIAATTPTYAWAIPPIGIIVAGSIAAVYGSKATKALNRVKAAKKIIQEKSADLSMATKLINSINASNITLSGNVESISAALPVIQKIQGVWGAISDDLQNISDLVKTNIQEALPIIMDLGVEAAISEWEAVGELADAYRMNAYITVTEEKAA